MTKTLPTVFAVITGATIYFARWVIRTAADAPGMTDQRPAHSSPGTKTPQDRARLAVYAARRDDQFAQG